VNKKYKDISPEELMDDRGFVSWILHGTNSEKWELFLHEHPEFSETVARTKELIAALDSGDEILPDTEVAQIWKSIETFHENRRMGKKIRTAWFIRIAASFLVLITGGIVALWIMSRNTEPYRFVSVGSQIESGDARLVLSTGENIRLKNENSKITVEEGKALYIENDSTVALANEMTGTGGKNSMNEVIVPFGKKSRILLSDGTKVWLNAGSRFAFPSGFTGKTREVFLEGEAYFEVTKSDRSFFVNTPDLKVKVFGTRFNVSAYTSDKRVETILLEGKVSVSANTAFGLKNREIVLEPFQKASYSKETHETLIMPEPEADIYISWTEGWLHFSKENISNVMKKLERYYNVKVVYDQSFYEQELISGKLDLKESLDEVMLVLTNVAPIIYRIDGNVIRIDRKMEGLPMIR
jgi:ferric-dicitrate binding protein FerR (iron transport regulator)